MRCLWFGLSGDVGLQTWRLWGYGKILRYLLGGHGSLEAVWMEGRVIVRVVIKVMIVVGIGRDMVVTVVTAVAAIVVVIVFIVVAIIYSQQY